MSKEGRETRVAVAILAAGSSTRFGPVDKLCAQFRGSRLGVWACRSLAGLDLSHKWVIAASLEHPCAEEWRNLGFTIMVNTNAERGQSTSVRRAAELAIEHDCSHLMIALADMPNVPPEHFGKLLDLAGTDSNGAVFVSALDERRSPPVIFPRAYFVRLTSSEGDAGARKWLKDAEPVACPDGWLHDIDRPSDLA